MSFPESTGASGPRPTERNCHAINAMTKITMAIPTNGLNRDLRKIVIEYKY